MGETKRQRELWEVWSTCVGCLCGLGKRELGNSDK